jgi:hypothetical protein
LWYLKKSLGVKGFVTKPQLRNNIIKYGNEMCYSKYETDV